MNVILTNLAALTNTLKPS